MTAKQLGFACCQVVQKPFALSFHVPRFWPDSARGSRVILPSGVNAILNLVQPGVEAVKGSPLKKVAWMSLGDIGSAAKTALAVSRIHTTVNGSGSRAESFDHLVGAGEQGGSRLIAETMCNHIDFSIAWIGRHLCSDHVIDRRAPR